MFTTITMLYYRRKNEKQDTPVYIISLPSIQPADDNRSRHDTIGGIQRTNTERYNPIMLPIEYLAGLSFTIAMGMALTALGSLGSDMPHYIFDYFRDFFPGLMSSIVIPLIFYARHAKARKFILSLFVRR